MKWFKRKKKRGTNVPEQKSVPPMPKPAERCCYNCKHTNKSFKDEPCCDCDPLTKIPDKWEPADE